MCRNKKRRGLTLVEVLVVLGIISLIMAMLIPAILFVRQASAALESSNNLKQIMLAIHQYELDYKKLPKLHSGQGSLHRAIIPYLELGNIFQSIAENNQVDSSDVYIKTYVSPIDPTQSPVVNGYSSYAANAQVFNKRRRLSTGVPDGATHTIAFAERYSFLIQHTSFSWFITIPDFTVLPEYTLLVRPATFADNGPEVQPYMGPPGGLIDAYPIYDPVSKRTRSSIPGLTFQIRPSISAADPRIPQTPHPAMIVSLMDASVRRLSGKTSEHTFWSAVTPNRGEVFDNDWDN